MGKRCLTGTPQAERWLLPIGSPVILMPRGRSRQLWHPVVRLDAAPLPWWFHVQAAQPVGSAAWNVAVRFVSAAGDSNLSASVAPAHAVA